MKIYLASKSPRRKELLKQMEIDFEVISLDTPEIVAVNESPAAYSKRITREKLEAAWDKIMEQNLPLLPVLCADTEVILDNIILGKPENELDAFNMLKRYSERTHEVITSVGIIYRDYLTVNMSKTLVTFSKMNDQDINHYLASGNYQDKSGGYGIQSYIGQFITKIEGCFYSVMGLPLSMVRSMLNDLKQQNRFEELG